MRILAVISGEYGQRHLDNLQAHGPAAWSISAWRAPAILPPIIDYPEDYLPASLPPAELVLSFAEHRGVAELLPDLARLCGARAVLAPVDSEAWLPRGLARQLRGWLAAMGVACATPKPLCSLTETGYWITRRERATYESPEIAEFARWFGRPRFALEIDAQAGRVVAARAERDAVCGCARHVAAGLEGISIDEAAEKAGLLHHHYPCLASMGKDPDFDDTLMHVSGNIFKDEIAAQVRPYLQDRYITPGKLAGETE
jgi:hypothetical protein